jgi:hypothetical protein
MMGVKMDLSKGESMEELFTDQPQRKEQDSPKEISTMADRLKKNELQKPIFQRDFVWEPSKIQGWIESVLDGKAIGVIVTYQIKGGGPIYLADGFQRLTATQQYMDDPQALGFVYGKKQARTNCESFEVTVQHRIYETHQDAMRAFQNLNKGTALTPAEFYKGELCLENPLGEIVYVEIPRVVEESTKMLVSGKAVSRPQASTLLRDSLGLFYQYISAHKGREFWQVGTRRLDPKKDPVERLLGEDLINRHWTTAQLHQQIQRFRQFIDEQIAEVVELAKETHQEYKTFSRTLLHWILHLAIWRKNNGRSFKLYQEFLSSLLQSYKEFKSFSSRTYVADSATGELIPVSMQVGRLSSLSTLSKGLGVDLSNGRRRQSTPPVKPGYNVSHLKPVSEYGEGETIIEPAPRNKARGAQIVQEQLPSP